MMSLVFMQSDQDPWSFFTSPGSNAKGIMLILGLVVLVAVTFFVWAAYVRTPRKSHTHYHSDDHDDSRRRRRSGLSRLFGRKHRRKRRSSRRERPVNPTLSQVGGLPPPRDGQRPPS